MEKAFIGIGKVVVLLITAALVGVILAFPIKWTWNATMPQIFNLIEITWWQAWCLSFLAGQFIQSSINHNSTT